MSHFMFYKLTVAKREFDKLFICGLYYKSITNVNLQFSLERSLQL